MKVREGFTMVELLISLVLLAFGILGMQTATARMVRTTIAKDAETVAAQIAEDRIDEIQGDPSYSTLTARYAEPPTPVEGQPGMNRETVVTRYRQTVGAREVDYTRVTVNVTGPGLARPVSRTISIGRP